jgi:hypothetical protein
MGGGNDMLSLKREPRFKARMPRVATTIRSNALLPDDREITLTIRNVSAEGFMALAPGALRDSASLREGTCFGVAVPGRGIVRAQVRWVEGDAFGARFERRLNLQEVVEEE